MFLPGVDSQQQKEVKRQAFRRIEQWCEAQLPEHVRPDCMVSVQEVVCGDPSCAPIDTAVTLSFKRYVTASVYFHFIASGFVVQKNTTLSVV
jgi:hypothetical protein